MSGGRWRSYLLAGIVAAGCGSSTPGGASGQRRDGRDRRRRRDRYGRHHGSGGATGSGGAAADGRRHLRATRAVDQGRLGAHQGRRSDAIIAALDARAAGATASCRSTSRSRSSSPTRRRRVRPSPRRAGRLSVLLRRPRLRSRPAADADPGQRQHRGQRQLHLRHVVQHRRQGDCHMLVVETTPEEALRALQRDAGRQRLHRARRLRLGSDEGLSRQRARRSVHLGRRRRISRSRRSCPRPTRSRPARSSTRSASSCPTRA